MNGIRLLFVLVCVLPLAAPASSGRAADRSRALNLYGGLLTSNDWEEIFTTGGDLDFNESYLLAVTLAKRVGTLDEHLGFEVEGQVVRHFNIQEHWEFNGLVAVRWESFWWDDLFDTSAAFGVGPSYATDKPEQEMDNDGDTSRLLVYWMLELAVSLPADYHAAVILRIHHRSDAFGLVADEGGSNAVAMGVKYRF